MKIDMTQPITDLDGKAMDDGTATLGKLCANVCWNPIKGDENANLDQKSKAAFLALKIKDANSVDLTAEEISLIKDRVNRAFPHPGIVARVHALLDPPAPKAVEAA